jgi:hypothetical protein
MVTGRDDGGRLALTRQRARRDSHRQAVWLNALHREAVSFNGIYVTYDPLGTLRGRFLVVRDAILSTYESATGASAARTPSSGATTATTARAARCSAAAS